MNRLAAVTHVLMAVALVALAGCDDEQASAQEGDAAAPPVEVGIVTTEAAAMPFLSELPGRIAPTRISEVRPRVSGILTERVFEQGATVEAGDPLFRIDPAQFDVELAAAEANLARAEAAATNARLTVDRSRRLVATSAVSEATYDTDFALFKQAEADVAAARADVRRAQLDLDYTTVTAPISGRIGRAEVTEGALVSADDATPLATIQQLDPVYADFQQPVSALTDLREALRSGRLQEVAPDAAQVRLLRDDGSDYPEPGKLLFSEASVDPDSGQVLLRGEFPNPDQGLLPGMYVRVVIEQGIDAEAITVPNQAIQRGASGLSQVYVVNDEDQVELRSVTASRVIGDLTVIDDGLAPGERVVAEGFQRIQPGATVTTTEWRETLGRGDETTTEAPSPSDVTSASDDASEMAEDGTANEQPGGSQPARVN